MPGFLPSAQELSQAGPFWECLDPLRAIGFGKSPVGWHLALKSEFRHCGGKPGPVWLRKPHLSVWPMYGPGFLGQAGGMSSCAVVG